MKITELEISDIGGIPYLKLSDINPCMNIICGENGVGKTNILECIAFAFSNTSQHEIKKRATTDRGDIHISYIDNSGQSKAYYNRIVEFLPEFYSYESADFGEKGYKIHQSNSIYLKVNRVFEYKYNESLKRDPLHDNYGENVVNGVSADDLKSWLINRDLFSGQKYLSEEQLYNLNLAKKFINSLSSEYTFSRIDTDHEIMISTDSGEIYFEYLSSGFKSAFFILLGILMDMEYKHGKNYIKADEYLGIILIDEIELHLHPEWQAKLIKILKQEFPKAQFFITTHSPHVIQSAEHNEIIALEKKESKDEKYPFEITQRDLPESKEYGFQGWSIEEILTDVMGMKTTFGIAYNEQMDRFSQALDDKSRQAAQEAYDELEKMIHPSSHMKKMLKIQMAGLR